jgi:light-regulated signal transduction histidine kinase (bacteriophytochrome)|tara:strand:+ start:726 stop:926 length:201 start_codon:yes stop_codon:yes gene_type:complete
MSKIKTSSTIKVFEENNTEIKVGQSKELQVKSHRHYSTLVILEYEDEAITVSADALRKAITNATNT